MDEDHVDSDGRRWAQVCSRCGIRRRFHLSPGGRELEVMDSVRQDCPDRIVRDVMNS